MAGARRQSHPFELAGQRPLARGGFLFLLLEPLLLLLEPRGVVALPRNALAAVELEDPLRRVVEEVAIVGDRHDRAGVFLEMALEPGDRFGVEVVGGLVEEEKVGLAQQDLAQRHPAPFAARDLADVGVARWAAQRIHGDFELAVELPEVLGVDLVLQTAELRRGVVGIVRRQLLVAAQHGALLGHRLLDVAEHVLGRVQERLLGQETDGIALVHERLAGEVLVLAGHDAQERGLARPVGADDADLGAVEKRKPDALEDLLALRGRLPQVLHAVDELRHASRPPEEGDCMPAGNPLRREGYTTGVIER